MARIRWHILREDGGLTLARHLPPRFDLAADTVLPCANPVAVAQQIRQDMWRLLRNVRGFSPTVRVAVEGDVLRVRAGGRAMSPVPEGTVDRLRGLLADPRLRARWIAQARRRGHV